MAGGGGDPVTGELANGPAGHGGGIVDPITAPQAVRQLLEIVARLQVSYPHKRFTLDGRLVGDLGEILVETAYDLRLFEDLTKHHDGRCGDGRLVQIKATMKDQLTFPADHTPELYLGIQIGSDGTFKEIFNGPGQIARLAVANRKPPKNNLHGIRLATLQALQPQVVLAERIPRRERGG